MPNLDYNDTRQEYYRQLDLCVRERDLSGFIRNAVLGFRDGLKGVLDIVQAYLLEMSWHKFIYDTLDSKKDTGKSRAIVKRRRTLALLFPMDQWHTSDDLVVRSGILAKEYATLPQQLPWLSYWLSLLTDLLKIRPDRIAGFTESETQ